MHDVAEKPEVNVEVLERLLACHRDFLGFLEKRLGDRVAAEEVPQTAFLRTLDKGGDIEDQERSVAWFYRLLRNAIVDHHRRRGAEARVLLKQVAEGSLTAEPELERVICACIHTLLPALNAGYAQLLRRVDFEDAPLETVARELGVTKNNAAVRLHRARQALKRQLEKSCGTCTEHGCLDCTCQAGHH